MLEAVRDDVGLGAAMSLLDRTGGGQGSSHLDDLDGLLGVADLHPEPAGFEAWLRAAFQRAADPAGITLSTIHRVKGREWDRVAVFGVADGVVPHRLAEDVEEERRVLHVAITRGRHRVALLADRTRRTAFLAELAGTAPRTPDRRPTTAAVVSTRRPATTAPAAADGIAASAGLVITVPGGHEGTVEEADGRSVLVRTSSGGLLRVRYGERVALDGRRAPLVAPTQLWGQAADAEAALRAWRTKRAGADGVPAYIVVNDKHLRGIALARPATPAELVACDGIGPAKLERYGDEILAVLEVLPMTVPSLPTGPIGPVRQGQDLRRQADDRRRAGRPAPARRRRRRLAVRLDGRGVGAAHGHPPHVHARRAPGVGRITGRDDRPPRPVDRRAGHRDVARGAGHQRLERRRPLVQLPHRPGARAGRDRGFGTEATRLIVDYVFTNLPIHRISLDVFAFNERAAHVYERAGFAREGVLRDNLYWDGVYHDSILMSILRPEWEAARDEADRDGAIP